MSTPAKCGVRATSFPVEPQVFDVLVVLLRERHRVVTKEELLDEIWRTRFVSESALTIPDQGTSPGPRRRRRATSA